MKAYSSKTIAVSLVSLLVALLSRPSDAAPQLTDRVKTALGLGPTREIVCASLLQLAVEEAAFKAVPSQYTLNTFMAYAHQFAGLSEQAALPSGFALLENGGFVGGSLSSEEVAARLKGILTLKESVTEEKLQSRRVLFSSRDSSHAEAVVKTLATKIGDWSRERTFIAFATTIHAGSLAGMYAVFLGALLAGDIRYAMLLAPFFYFTEGFEGLRKMTPGHNAAGDINGHMRRFLSPSHPGPRSFLLSESVRLGPELIAQLSGEANRFQAPWTTADQMMDMENKSLPLLVLRWIESKPLWVHTDMLIERHANGELETHFFVQFSREIPRFPRKPKPREQRQTRPLFEGSGTPAYAPHGSGS